MAGKLPIASESVAQTAHRILQTRCTVQCNTSEDKCPRKTRACPIENGSGDIAHAMFTVVSKVVGQQEANVHIRVFLDPRNICPMYMLSNCTQDW